MCCPQNLWISLCTLPELMRYVRADKVIISVGEIIEHNSNSTTPEWALPPAVLRVHQLHHTFNDAHVSPRGPYKDRPHVFVLIKYNHYD